MANTPDGHMSDVNGEATPLANFGDEARGGANAPPAPWLDQLRDWQNEIDKAMRQLE